MICSNALIFFRSGQKFNPFLQTFYAVVQEMLKERKHPPGGKEKVPAL
jgi:hypothetical protein